MTTDQTEGAGGLRRCRLTCGLSFEIDDAHEFIQSTIARTGMFEPGVTAVLSRLLQPEDLFLDVGANIGYHTLVAASRGAAVHAFEPVPRLADRVRRNAALNQLESQIHVVDAAVSNRSGTSHLYVAARADDGSHSLLQGVKASSVETIPVRLTTLDVHLADAARLPTVVKIDVEGCEALVLDGASETLGGVPSSCWIVETGDRLADQLGECAASVLDRLFSRGYRVFRISESPVALLEIEPGLTTRQLADYLGIHRDSPRIADIEDLVDPLAGSEYRAWFAHIRQLERDLAAAIPRDSGFILVDEDRLRFELSTREIAVPFPERNGEFWGLPPDGGTAMSELERLRNRGPSFIVFVASTFWWLDHYDELRRYLESRCRSVLHNDRVRVFALARTHGTTADS